MTIRKITVNNNEYEFINNSRSTRNGFAHDTTLFKNGVEIGTATCHYLNRTWESYTYQTVMQRCINNIDTNRYDRFIDNYKAENNIKRMTAEKRMTADKEFYSRADIVELLEVYEQLKHSN
jgi:capsid portal protein